MFPHLAAGTPAGDAAMVSMQEQSRNPLLPWALPPVPEYWLFGVTTAGPLPWAVATALPVILPNDLAPLPLPDPAPLPAEAVEALLALLGAEVATPDALPPGTPGPTVTEPPVPDAAPRFADPVPGPGGVPQPRAADPEGDLLTWRIAGGADAALFLLNPASGALSFLVAPDPAQPADADRDGLYEVLIEAKDAWGNAATTLHRLRVEEAEDRLPFRADEMPAPFDPQVLDTGYSARDWAMI
jgi:hypothetical protein